MRNIRRAHIAELAELAGAVLVSLALGLWHLEVGIGAAGLLLIIWANEPQPPGGA